MNPPTCRSCGKAEWQHICGGMNKRAIKKAVDNAVARNIAKAEKMPAKRAGGRFGKRNAKGR